MVPIALATAALVIAGEWIGARWPAGWNWGFNAFAFLPPPVLPLATLAAGVLAAIAWRSGSAKAPAATPSAPPATTFFHPLTLALAALAGAAFYAMRTRHLLLGDGLLVGSAPTDWQVPPLEPLSGVLVQAFWRVVRILPFETGRAANLVAWDAAAIGSCMAGAVLVALTPGLIRALGAGSHRHADADEHQERGSEWGSTALWAMAAFLLQGWLVLVCGYPETYAYSLVGLVVYLRFCAEVADGLRPLRHAGFALLLAIGLHLSAFALAPSFLFLAWLRLRNPSTRHEAGRDLALVGLVCGRPVRGAGGRAAGRVPAGHPARNRGRCPGRRGTAQRRWPARVVAPRGPGRRQALSGSLFGGLLRGAARSRRCCSGRGAARDPPSRAAAVRRRHALHHADRRGFQPGLRAQLGPGRAVGHGDDGLWPRVAAGAGAGRTALRRVLVALTLASAVHTLGWVAVNTSQAASIARFTTLPLGMGRVESTLGYWYLLRGDAPAAERWLARALNANPANLRAHLHFAIMFSEQHRYAMAVEAYRAVVALRPASVEYGLSLADALRLNGDLAGAAVELKRVLALDPQSTRARMMYGTVLIDLGRVSEARDVLSGARTAPAAGRAGRERRGTSRRRTQRARPRPRGTPRPRAVDAGVVHVEVQDRAQAPAPERHHAHAPRSASARSSTGAGSSAGARARRSTMFVSGSDTVTPGAARKPVGERARAAWSSARRSTWWSSACRHAAARMPDLAHAAAPALAQAARPADQRRRRPRGCEPTGAPSPLREAHAHGVARAPPSSAIAIPLATLAFQSRAPSRCTRRPRSRAAAASARRLRERHDRAARAVVRVLDAHERDVRDVVVLGRAAIAPISASAASTPPLAGARRARGSR